MNKPPEIDTRAIEQLLRNQYNMLYVLKPQVHGCLQPLIDELLKQTKNTIVDLHEFNRHKP